MDKPVKVTLEFEGKRITLTGPKDFVREEIERMANGLVNRNPKSPDSELGSMSTISERQLIAEKRPLGHAEIIAVLAFGLKKQGNDEFTAEDVRRSYIRANVRPPKVIDQAMRDAKNKQDYVESGSKRGTFRLSSHGERTVLFDLPRKEPNK